MAIINASEQVKASVNARRHYSGPVILEQGFRPFFLAAGVWAVVALAIWLWEFSQGGILPTHLAPVVWHSHEMLFGYGSAVVTGFLLTAVPNWTGRLPVRGAPLAALAFVWLAGRVAFSFATPSWLLVASLIEGSYLVLLCGFLVREIVSGKNWRNLIVAALVAGIAIANGFVHWEIVGFGNTGDFGFRLGIGVFVILITLVGGRVTPSFTRNWLNKNGSKNLPAPFGVPDKVALVTTLVAVAGWVAAPFNEISGGLVLLATAAQAVRLSRWQGHHCFSEPLVLALHVGYAWLVLGLGLLGFAILFDYIPQSAALHGLTVGMIGTMTLAVMTRASLGHSGQPLRADLATQTIFVLVVCAALTRVVAPLMGEDYLFYLMLAGGLWIATFSLFVIRYLPLWTRK